MTAHVVLESVTDALVGSAMAMGATICVGTEEPRTRLHDATVRHRAHARPGGLEHHRGTVEAVLLASTVADVIVAPCGVVLPPRVPTQVAAGGLPGASSDSAAGVYSAPGAGHGS